MMIIFLLFLIIDEQSMCPSVRQTREVMKGMKLFPTFLYGERSMHLV